MPQFQRGYLPDAVHQRLGNNPRIPDFPTIRDGGSNSCHLQGSGLHLALTDGDVGRFGFRPRAFVLPFPPPPVRHEIRDGCFQPERGGLTKSEFFGHAGNALNLHSIAELIKITIAGPLHRFRQGQKTVPGAGHLNGPAIKTPAAINDRAAALKLSGPVTGFPCGQSADELEGGPGWIGTHSAIHQWRSLILLELLPRFLLMVGTNAFRS